MRNDTNTYLRCVDCGAYVNSSEEQAHECPPKKKEVGKRGCCLKCGSKNLLYRQDVTEYHTFERDQFPSEDGCIDLIDLESVYAHANAVIVCLNCEAEFTLGGDHCEG